MAPFPYLPMTAILTSLVSSLVVQMSVFSYSGFMVEYLGVVDDKDKAAKSPQGSYDSFNQLVLSGYYAGLLTSSFMFGRLVSSHFWGVAASRFGCRLVLVVGLVSGVVFSLAFGTSTTFTWAFIFRFLLGLTNGILSASKTLVSEVCGKEHEVVGMGVVTTAWSLGTIVGPGIGGILSEPASYYPDTFSQNGIFGRNPYLLPNVVGAGMSLLSLPLVFLFLKKNEHDESIFPPLSAWWPLGDDCVKDYCAKDDGGYGREANRGPSKTTSSTPPQKALGTSNASPPHIESGLQSDPRSGRDHAAEHVGCDLSDVEPPPSLLAQPHIRTLLVLQGVYSCVYSGFDEVFALWSLSTVTKGGLDWSSQQIGQVLIVSGLMVLVFEILAVPNITPRLGVRLCQRLGSFLEVPVYFFIPLLSRLNGAGVSVSTASIIVLVIILVGTNTYYMSLSLTMNNATGPERRGELNGISSTVGSLARAISPVLFSALFALSIDGDHPFPFDYRLVFFLLGLLRLTVAYMGWDRLNGAGHEEERLDTGTSNASEATLDEYIGSE